MELLPSIDLMGGRVVRLLQGDPRRAKVYHEDPLAVARRWEEEGADGLHIVDLDATLDRGTNLGAVKRLTRASTVPVQVGGGIRSVDRALELLGAGAARVVLGTMAFADPQGLRLLLGEVGPERIVVALDHRGGRVVVQGWREQTRLEVREALNTFLDMGVYQFLITAVERDGALAGPDIEVVRDLAHIRGVRIYASGGVRSIEDLRRLEEAGAWGVVVGKALYEGLFTLREAVDALRGGGLRL
jgi:phosphoribosylformimino-5-aminoimidazole carboxamide ribotide isomerase